MINPVKLRNDMLTMQMLDNSRLDCSTVLYSLNRNIVQSRFVILVVSVSVNL